MKTLAGILAIAALCALAAQARPSFPGAAVAADALIEKAHLMENLRGDGGKPFLFRATVTIQRGKQQSAGEYGLNWWSGERWQETVKLADFGRGREGVQGGYWQSRTVDYQPEAIFDMDLALDPAAILRLGSNEAIVKLSEDKNHGNALSCVGIGKKQIWKTLCFEQSSGRLVRVQMGIPDERTIEYSDFKSLLDFSPDGGKQFPGTITVAHKVGDPLKISVTKISSLTTAAPDVAKGPQSEFWLGCEDASVPIVDKQTFPRYPQDSKLNHEQGVVVLFARIEADGSVTHLKPLSNSPALLTQSAMDAVSQWKYKPALCGGTPVPREITVSVTYTLGG
jgi:TonB family protein